MAVTAATEHVKITVLALLAKAMIFPTRCSESEASPVEVVKQVRSMPRGPVPYGIDSDGVSGLPIGTWFCRLIIGHQ